MKNKTFEQIIKENEKDIKKWLIIFTTTFMISFILLYIIVVCIDDVNSVIYNVGSFILGGTAIISIFCILGYFWEIIINIKTKKDKIYNLLINNEYKKILKTRFVLSTEEYLIEWTTVSFKKIKYEQIGMVYCKQWKREHTYNTVLKVILKNGKIIQIVAEFGKSMVKHDKVVDEIKLHVPDVLIGNTKENKEIFYERYGKKLWML